MIALLLSAGCYHDGGSWGDVVVLGGSASERANVARTLAEVEAWWWEPPHLRRVELVEASRLPSTSRHGVVQVAAGLDSEDLRPILVHELCHMLDRDLGITRGMSSVRSPEHEGYLEVEERFADACAVGPVGLVSLGVGRCGVENLPMEWLAGSYLTDQWWRNSGDVVFDARGTVQLAGAPAPLARPVEDGARIRIFGSPDHLLDPNTGEVEASIGPLDVWEPPLVSCDAEPPAGFRGIEGDGVVCIDSDVAIFAGVYARELEAYRVLVTDENGNWAPSGDCHQVPVVVRQASKLWLLALNHTTLSWSEVVGGP